MIVISMFGKLPAGISRQDVERAVGLAFKKSRRRPSGELSVAFVSAARMKKLNKKWRGKKAGTDVLSFATPKMGMVKAKDWGDVVVDPAFVRRDAKQAREPFKKELLRVVIHGTLHLLGFDHATSKEEKRMFGLQERALNQALVRV